MSARTSGPHVLVLKYLHLERAIERVYVSVGIQRGSTAILPCKFAFACRQLVLNDERGPKAFQLTANPEGNVVQLETSSSAKLALVWALSVMLVYFSLSFLSSFVRSFVRSLSLSFVLSFLPPPFPPTLPSFLLSPSLLSRSFPPSTLPFFILRSSLPFRPSFLAPSGSPSLPFYPPFPPKTIFMLSSLLYRFL